MMKTLFCCILVLGSVCASPAAADDHMRVVFINPGFSVVDNPTGGFWLSVSAFMKAAAADLDIDLEILYCDRNHIKMRRAAESVIHRTSPPDYLIVVNEKLSAEPVVMDADRAGIKVFVILNRFEGDQHQKMGDPRKRYKNWIGSLVPDNAHAGYETAKLLIDQSLASGVLAPDGRLHMIAYSGDYVTPASVERIAGLKQALSRYPDVVLEQVVPCHWSKDEAREKTPKILKRYPMVGAIWCANDPIALGAMQGAETVGRIPGRNVLLAGLNWDPPGLEKVRTGEMVASVGGHFMTGGWALVLLYDYHHGRDFADGGTRLQYQIFGALDRQNISRFLEKFGGRDWNKIDFTAFSRVLHPDDNAYAFNVEAILNQ